MNFGESESSLLDPDKSLGEGMLVTEKRKWHCKMKPRGLNICFGPVTTFKGQGKAKCPKKMAQKRVVLSLTIILYR